jgi:transcriptional regulator with XRE-family HTH domain
VRRRRTERAGQYQTTAYRTLQGSLASNVRRLRLERGWTQEEAAHRCTMATRLLQRVEAGSVNATLTTLARICHGFRIEVVQLFGRPSASLSVADPRR